MASTIRQQILAAASSCFASDGYDQTTMGQIARQAGVAPATLYRHFRNKEELFAALGRPDLRGAETKPYRARILDAALELFSQRGYQATTLTAVAAAAGVARTTLYAEFPTKESILLGIMSENPVIEWASGVTRRESTRDPLADLTTLAHRIIIQEQDPRRIALVRLLVAEGVRFEALQAHYHHGEAQVFDSLGDYLHSLVPTLEDPPFAARLFLSGLLGLVRQNLVPGGAPPAYSPELLAKKVAIATLYGLNAGSQVPHPKEESGNDSPRP